MLLAGKNTQKAPHSSSKPPFAGTLQQVCQHSTRITVRIPSLLLCSSPPVSHFGRSLLLFPGAIPHHKSWFCSSHAEDLPQELLHLHPSLGSVSSSSDPFLPKGPREGHSGPSLYWSHSLPRLVELGQGTQWPGLAPSPLGSAGKERSWSQICVWN